VRHAADRRWQIALPALWLALATSAHARGRFGAAGSQLHFNSIAELLFVLVFMVVAVILVGITFGIVGGVLGLLGGLGRRMVETMRVRQSRALDARRETDERLERRFPCGGSTPDWAEARAEIAAGHASLESLWDEYRSARRGVWSQAEFADRYGAWRDDAEAQLQEIEILDRSCVANREVKLFQSYQDALAALEHGGDRARWTSTQLRFADIERNPTRAACAYERALNASIEGSDDWARAQYGLAHALNLCAETLPHLSEAAPYLARAAEAYECLLSAPKPQVSVALRLEYAHVLLRLGRSGDERAAAKAERAYDEALAEMDRDHDPAAWARAKLNIANAVETQGDAADGADARRYYERARLLYEEALRFWSEKKLARYTRMKRNLARVEEKLRHPQT
jgi:hypothetical protein